jgi:hypothetical protein
MAIGKTSLWATVQAQNAKRKANFAAARARTENTMNSIMSVSSSNTAGIISLTEQMLRGKQAAKVADMKQQALKAQQSLNSLDMTV